MGDAIRVPPDADAETREQLRRLVEERINATTARAYAIVDGEGAGRD